MVGCHFKNIVLFIIILLMSGCHDGNRMHEDIPATPVTPSLQQLEYQQMEMVGFIHFTVNTFTDREWGYGDEDPAIFNPTGLDVEQWVLTAKAGGLKELILTAKHHDGFCLWPSRYTEHSIKNSPYKNGKGDIVREFTDACRKNGLKAGLYLSPWDRNHADYGKPAYITYYRNQLWELLTKYGEISEIWFDGANGGDGYYGGARETRRIDRRTYYDWDSTFALVKSLQPDICIFSDAGPDIRWVGNENGFAGETFWSTINAGRLVIGASDPAYLNRGDPAGNRWLIGSCDVSIRPGWFYHQNQDSLVKSPQQLMEIYYKSVGRNGVLLLNLPPDRRGRIHENDSVSLVAFKQIVDGTFSKNLALGASVEASNTRSGFGTFSADRIVDGNQDTFWATDDSVRSAEIIIELPAEQTFDRILIMEPVRFGQRISKFRFHAGAGEKWLTVAEGTTIGYKRILCTEPVTARKVKLEILDALYPPAISEFGLFQSD